MTETLKLSDLQVHEEAYSTPPYTDDQFTALKCDIEENGQLQPVIIFRGKIIDGRHRFLALTDLGIETIVCKVLPNNTTIEEIRSIVCSCETRRHKSPTQLAIYAWKQKNRVILDGEKMTQVEAGRKYGASVKQIKRVASIHRARGESILDILFQGNKINIGNASRPLMSDSLASIESWIKKTDSELSTKDIGIEARTELTSDEEVIVEKFLLALENESPIVKENISQRLYAIVKG